MTAEERIAELEADMLRVIDMCILLEHTVEYQERLLKQTLTELATYAASISRSDQLPEELNPKSLETLPSRRP